MYNVVRGSQSGANRINVMRKSVNIWDAIFGKRIVVEVPGPFGHVRRITVTEKWMKKMIAQKRAHEVNNGLIRLIMDGPHGERTATLRLGVDIDEQTVGEFFDFETAAVYGMYCYKDGEEVQFFVSRKVYEETKKILRSNQNQERVYSDIKRELGLSED